MVYFDQNTAVVELNNYLKKNLKFLNKNEFLIKTETAGEGNMNVVMRLKTNQRSFILKQSRPFVYKFPELDAPLNRINVEYNFYSQMGRNPLFPKILNYSPKIYLLLMEDLGACEDLTFIYEKREISKNIIKKLVEGLKYIHQRKISSGFPENRGLRKLNHKHIFVLPFSGNPLDLDNIQKGLQELARPFRENKVLNKKVSDAGKVYLDKGCTLLHGDFYPGSWIYSDKRLHIIDPEFSFLGPCEFDLGVMAAHLIITTGQISLFEYVCKIYHNNLDIVKAKNFCGIEIIRRLIGLAQLPLKQNLDKKRDILNLAKNLILS